MNVTATILAERRWRRCMRAVRRAERGIHHRRYLRALLAAAFAEAALVRANRRDLHHSILKIRITAVDRFSVTASGVSAKLRRAFGVDETPHTILAAALTRVALMDSAWPA